MLFILAVFDHSVSNHVTQFRPPKPFSVPTKNRVYSEGRCSGGKHTLRPRLVMAGNLKLGLDDLRPDGCVGEKEAKCELDNREIVGQELEEGEIEER